MHTTANRFNVGLLVWAGRSGGGGLAPGSSEGVAAALETRRTPSHELQPWAAAEGERGQANCEDGGSVTDPGMRLSCHRRLAEVNGSCCCSSGVN